MVFIGLTLILQSFSKPEVTERDASEDFSLVSSEAEYPPGDSVIINITNNLDQTFLIDSKCPANPLKVEKYVNGVWIEKSLARGLYLECLDAGAVIGKKDAIYFYQSNQIELKPNSAYVMDFSPWKFELFDGVGKYKISMAINVDNVEKNFSTEFDVVEGGFFSSVAYNLFFRPIFNFLLYLTTVIPGQNLGMAIIILTLIIRIILLLPNQKALRSQRAMMKIQPEIEAVKKKYQGNQEKISMETLALWKKHRVSPLGGCLPMLLQLPILIALFYVVKTDFSPYEAHMVYNYFNYQDLVAVDTNFYGILDMQVINITWLPLLVGLMQYVQMKMSFSKYKSGKEQYSAGKEIIDINDAEKEKNIRTATADTMQMMNKTMIYFMPIMIAFMVASLPSGVGLYLVISTLFGIGQQMVVNKNV